MATATGNGNAATGAVAVTTEPAKPVSTADRYRQLLQDDPKMALELALAESERAKTRYAESREVLIDEHGNFQIRSLYGLMQLAELYANSGLVPDHFKKKPSDCAIGIALANRLRLDSFLVLQNMYVVHGRPAFEAKFLIAIVNSSDQILGRMEFKLAGEGKTRHCIASAKDKETGIVHSQRVDMAMAEAEGWTRPRKDQISKWVTMPDVMLQYRSAAFLAKLSFPDVVMGMSTVDELEDFTGESVERNQNTVAQADLSSLFQKIGAADSKGEPAEQVKTEQVSEEKVEATSKSSDGAAATEAKPDSGAVQPNGKEPEIVSPSNSATATTAPKEPVIAEDPAPSPKLQGYMQRIKDSKARVGVASIVKSAENDKEANFCPEDLCAIRTAAEDRMFFLDHQQQQRNSK